jgi:signal recognition particle receptor subunit beta
MVVVSYSGKEVNAKIVYYGPGLCGKTTNLERIYESVPAGNKGKMISMKTKADRTLFFDFLPIELGEIGGFRTRFMLYTVPGQVYYNATRKLVLKGADAVVFVADSERGKMPENQASLENLRENLASYGVDPNEIPIVFQYNKRDLPDVYTIEEMDEGLTHGRHPSMEAVAETGQGVFETLRLVSELLLARLRLKLGGATDETDGTVAGAKPAAGPATAVPPAPPRPVPPVPAAPPDERLVSRQPVESLPPLDLTRSPDLEAEPPTSSEDSSPLPGLERGGDLFAPSGPPPRAKERPASRTPKATAPRPQLEVVHLEPENEIPSESTRAEPTAPRRLLVPVKIDLSDVEDGEAIELVLRLEISRGAKDTRQISR